MASERNNPKNSRGPESPTIGKRIIPQEQSQCTTLDRNHTKLELKPSLASHCGVRDPLHRTILAGSRVLVHSIVLRPVRAASTRREDLKAPCWFCAQCDAFRVMVQVDAGGLAPLGLLDEAVLIIDGPTHG